MPIQSHALVALNTICKEPNDFTVFKRFLDLQYLIYIDVLCQSNKPFDYPSLFINTYEAILQRMPKGAQLILPLFNADKEVTPVRRVIKDFLDRLLMDGYKIIVFTKNKENFLAAFGIARNSELSQQILHDKLFSTLQEFGDHLQGLSNLAKRNYVYRTLIEPLGICPIHKFPKMKLTAVHVDPKIFRDAANDRTPDHIDNTAYTKTTPKPLVFRPAVFPSHNADINNLMHFLVFISFCTLLRKLLRSKKTHTYTLKNKP